MRKLEDFINKLTDMDWGWWPFVFLRPKKNEYMTNSVVLRISLYFGSCAGLILGIYVYIDSQSFLYFIIAIIYGIVALFILVKLITATFWNKRAKRLLGENKK